MGGGQLRWARLVLLLVKPHYLMEQDAVVGVCLVGVCLVG